MKSLLHFTFFTGQSKDDKAYNHQNCGRQWNKPRELRQNRPYNEPKAHNRANQQFVTKFNAIFEDSETSYIGYR